MQRITNINVSQETLHRARWEMIPSKLTIMADVQPGNPYRKGNEPGKPGSEYPKMLYIAQHTPGTGKYAVSLPIPSQYGFRDGNEWDRACASVNEFNRSCQRIVNSED